MKRKLPIISVILSSISVIASAFSLFFSVNKQQNIANSANFSEKLDEKMKQLIQKYKGEKLIGAANYEIQNFYVLDSGAARYYIVMRYSSIPGGKSLTDTFSILLIYKNGQFYEEGELA